MVAVGAVGAVGHFDIYQRFVFVCREVPEHRRVPGADGRGSSTRTGTSCLRPAGTTTEPGDSLPEHRAEGNPDQCTLKRAIREETGYKLFFLKDTVNRRVESRKCTGENRK